MGAKTLCRELNDIQHFVMCPMMLNDSVDGGADDWRIGQQFGARSQQVDLEIWPWQQINQLAWRTYDVGRWSQTHSMNDNPKRDASALCLLFVIINVDNGERMDNQLILTKKMKTTTLKIFGTYEYIIYIWIFCVYDL